MNNLNLLETVADVSYIAGYEKHYSGNSRFDISEYIHWAKEFEQINKNTDWDYEDYMLAIEQFATEKIKLTIVEDIAFG